MKTCTACWRPLGGEEQPCGEPAQHAAADSYFCDYHYERAIKWASEVARVETSLVYYARRESDGLIKIGTSRTIITRWATLTGEHGPLALMAAHRGAHREEHAIHRQFTALRVEKEWFRPELPLIEHILKARKVDLRVAEELPPLLDLLELGRMVRRLKRDYRDSNRKVLSDWITSRRAARHAARTWT